MAINGPMRTDRGFVVVTEMAGGAYMVEICEKLSSGGQPENVYAKHVGVPEVVADPFDILQGTREVRFSYEPLEVFVNGEDGKLYVRSMRGKS